MSENYALYQNLIKKANQLTAWGFVKTGQVTEVYDKEIGKTALEIKGALAAKNNINLRSPKKPIRNYRYLIMQFRPEAAKDFSFVFRFKVNKDQAFKLNFSNLNRANKFMKDHTWNIKLDNQEVWTFLVIDIKTIITKAFTRFTCYELEEIAIYPHIRLKNIVFSDAEFKVDAFPKDIEICANLNIMGEYKLLKLDDLQGVKEVEVEQREVSVEEIKPKKRPTEAYKLKKNPKKLEDGMMDEQAKEHSYGRSLIPQQAEREKAQEQGKLKKYVQVEMEEPKQLQVKQRNMVDLAAKVNQLEQENRIQKSVVASVHLRAPRPAENKFLIPSPIFGLEYLSNYHPDSQFQFANKDFLLFSSSKNVAVLNTITLNARLIRIPIGDLSKFVFVKEKGVILATNSANPCTLFLIDYISGAVSCSFSLTERYETLDIDYAMDPIDKDILMVLLAVRSVNSRVSMMIIQVDTQTLEFSIRLKEELKADCIKVRFRSQGRSTDALSLQRMSLDYLHIKGTKLERLVFEDHRIDPMDKFTDFVVIEDPNPHKPLQINYYVLLSSEKGLVYLYDCVDRAFLKSVRAHTAKITFLNFDRQTETIVSGDGLGKLKFWSIDINDEIAQYDLGHGIVSGVTCPNTETCLVYLSNNSLGLVDKVQGTLSLLSKSHCDKIIDCCYNKALGYLVTISQDNRILIWETENSFGVIYEIESKDSSLTFCCSENKGSKILVGVASSHVRVFNLANFKYVEEIKVSEQPIMKGKFGLSDRYCVLVDRSFTLLVLDKGYKVLYNIEPLYQLKGLDSSLFVLDLDITNKHMLYTINDNTLGLHDLKTRKLSAKIISEHKIKAARLAFIDEIVLMLDATNTLYFYKKSDDGVSAYVITKSVKGLNSTDTLTLYSSVNCKYVFSLGANGNLRVWDFYFRGQIKPEYQEIELNEGFDSLLVTEDKNRKVFVIGKQAMRIACVKFKGSFAVDEYLDELTKIKKGMGGLAIDNGQKALVDDGVNTSLVRKDLAKSIFTKSEAMARVAIQEKSVLSFKDNKSLVQAQAGSLIDETRVLPAKLNTKTRVLTGMSLCPRYQPQIMINISKGYFMHLVGNRLLLHHLNPEKTKEEFEIGDEITGFNLLVSSPDKSKVLIGCLNTPSHFLKVYLYNTTYLKTCDTVIVLDDLEYLQAARIDTSNSHLLIIGKCDSTNGSKIKLFDLSKKNATLLCETALKEQVEDANWVETGNSEKEFVVISQKSVFFFKLTPDNELKFLTVDFADFNYFEIDFSHRSVSVIEMLGSHYAFIGSYNGSLIVVDIKTASVVLSIPFMFKRSILEVRVRMTKNYLDALIFDWVYEVIVAVDSENLVVFDKFKATDMGEFINQIYKIEKRMLNTDGHVVSMDFDAADTSKGLLLTSNASVFFLDVAELANVKVASWHASTPNTLVYDSYQQAVVVGASDNNISYYENKTFDHIFTFLTPGKSCTVLSLFRDNSVVVAGFDDGSLRFYSEESYIGNSLIEKGGCVIAVKSLDDFPSNLVVGTKTGIYLTSIDSNLNLKVQKILDLKIASMDLRTQNSEITISAVVEGMDVVSWQLVDVLSDIGLPKNNVNTFRTLGLETVSLHQIDSFAYDLKSASATPRLKYYPYESRCICLYNDSSPYLIIRNIKDHKTIAEIRLPDCIFSLTFAQLYRALLVGTVGGRLVIFDVDRMGIIYSEYVHNERIIDMVEELRPAEYQDVRNKQWYSDIHVKLILLTASCLLEFKC